MSTTLQRADTSSPPEEIGRHSISPFLLLVLLTAVLWIAALRIRRRRARGRATGEGDGIRDRSDHDVPFRGSR
jgi:hypothetical protein